MTVTKPYITTPTVGAKITAAGFGTEVVNDVAYFNNPPRVSVITPTTTTLTIGGILMSWSAEEYDTHAMHDTVTNNSRISILASGTYILDACIRGTSSNTDGVTVQWRKNAAGNIASGTQLASSGFDLVIAGSATVICRKVADLTSGDYVEVFVNKVQPATTTTVSNTAAFTYAQVTLLAYA